MREVRSYYAYGSSAFNPKHGWVITGGCCPTSSSAERTRDGRSFEPFTDLPIALDRHCLVSLDGGHGDFFLTAGVGNNGDNKKTYIYRDNAWRQMADAPTARNGMKSISLDVNS